MGVAGLLGITGLALLQPLPPWPCHGAGRRRRPAGRCRRAAAAAATLAAIAARIPGAKPEDLRATPIPGIYELRHGAEIIYVTADGKYAFAGDLYRLADRDQPHRGAAPRAAPGAAGATCRNPRCWCSRRAAPKYTITVFTDVDCAYCRALHSQIAEYNRLGISVRYMFFPRSGPGHRVLDEGRAGLVLAGPQARR